MILTREEIKKHLECLLVKCFCEEKECPRRLSREGCLRAEELLRLHFKEWLGEEEDK
jgi:hypothetical protein